MLFVKYVYVADPDLQISGGGGEGCGHPDPEIRGMARSPKNFFSALSPGSLIGFIFLPCLLFFALFPKLPFMTIGHFRVPPASVSKRR